MEQQPEQQSTTLKRDASGVENEMEIDDSPCKAARESVEMTSPHDSIAYQNGKQADAANMPPPLTTKVPTPRRKVSPPVGGMDGTIFGDTFKNFCPKSVGMGRSLSDQSLTKRVVSPKRIVVSGGVMRGESPKSSRVTKVARRTSLKFTVPLETLTKDIPVDPNGNRRITHDLGVPSGLVSLFSAPIKCNPSDISSPGKENCLGVGIRTLHLEGTNGEQLSPVKVDPFGRLIPKHRVDSPESKRLKWEINDDGIIIKTAIASIAFKDSKGGVESVVRVRSASSPVKPNIRAPLCPRSQSESCISVMRALDRSEEDPMLIGDLSRRFLLPIEPNGGKLADLRQISVETVAALVEGKYSGVIDSFEIIDCRYPYEYHGGHITGALNLHTMQQVNDEYLKYKSAKPLGSLAQGKNILIFHCEFSSERGPNMCRYLRGADRECNRESFPALHFPELYLMQGGYKAFFKSFKELCIPCLYKPMADPEHTEELKLYRNKSRTESTAGSSTCKLKPKTVPMARRPLKKLML